MFVCSKPFQHDTLCLYYADTLFGPWQAHPQNPLIQDDAHRARPGGRVTVLGNRIIRYAQDDAPFYGKQVRAFEVTTLTTTRYAEREVPKVLCSNPLVLAGTPKACTILIPTDWAIRTGSPVSMAITQEHTGD